MKVRQYVKEVKKGNIDVVENIHKVFEEAKKINKEYNYFNTFSEKLALEKAKKIQKQLKKGKVKGKLLGLPVSVKDCICVQGTESTAGSKMLQGYKPIFDATVIDKVKVEGAIIIGKTSQDEFGFGGFNVNVGVDFKVPKNPIDKKRSTGGSSGGSAGYTKLTKHSHISLAESTGGSIVCPASFCGVEGLCPTYGSVSRYGLMDYGSSLDKIGPIAKYKEDCKLMFDVIKGKDEKDSTTTTSLKASPEVKKIGIIKECLDVDENVREIVLNKIDSLGYETKEISLPLSSKYSNTAYYIIALSEASTNLAKLCGIRYGLEQDIKEEYNEYFTKVRFQAFGKEAKRRILLGTFARMAGYRDAYYLKAMKVRAKIIQEYKKAFNKVDILATPTMPIISPKFNEISKLSLLQTYMMDRITSGPNLAGLPHHSTTAGYHKDMPVGLMMIADHFHEGKLLGVKQ